MSLMPTTKSKTQWLIIGLQPALVLVLLLTGHAIAFPLVANAGNSGHSGGCNPKEGGLAEFPQNSLICLKAVVHGIALDVDDGDEIKIGPVRTQSDFEYLEIDLRETQDHQLVIYDGRRGKIFNRRRNDGATIRHEFLNARLFSRIRQAIVQRGGSRRSWKSATVADLTLNELQSLFLAGDLVQRVPTLEEYLSETRRLQYDGRLMINLKGLQSDAAKARLLDLVSNYEATGSPRNPVDEAAFDAQRVGLMVNSATTQARVFGSGCGSNAFRWWSGTLQDRNIRLYRAKGEHPLILPKSCGKTSRGKL